MGNEAFNALLNEAQAAPPKTVRSKLEPHRAVIRELRGKHWTFADIATWLKERGIEATTSTVHRFYQRTKHLPVSPPASKKSATPTTATPPAPPAEKPKRKRRFNLPI